MNIVSYRKSKIRNILSKTDWLFVSDNPIPAKRRKYYKEYRQLLRDHKSEVSDIETFDHWLKRNYPNEFMDGGEASSIIKQFNSYIIGI